MSDAADNESALSGNAADGAFLDIATNTLAVLIVVLASRIFALDTPPTQRLTDAAAVPPNLPFPVTRDQLFRPFVTVHLVENGHLVSLDLTEVVETIQQTRRWRGQVDQGAYELAPEPFAVRDVNSYRFEIDVADDLAVRSGRSITTQSVPSIVEDLQVQLTEGHTAPVFVVRPSGMDAFAHLYPEILAANVSVRWFPLPEDQPVPFSRTHGNLQFPSFYW